MTVRFAYFALQGTQFLILSYLAYTRAFGVWTVLAAAVCWYFAGVELRRASKAGQ